MSIKMYIHDSHMIEVIALSAQSLCSRITIRLANFKCGECFSLATSVWSMFCGCWACVLALKSMVSVRSERNCNTIIIGIAHEACNWNIKSNIRQPYRNTFTSLSGCVCVGLLPSRGIRSHFGSLYRYLVMGFWIIIRLYVVPFWN